MTDSNPASSAENPRNSGSRSRSTGQKWRRRGPLVALICIALLAASTAWLGYRASTLRDDLHAAAQLVPLLKAEVLKDNQAGAAATLDELKIHTAGARRAAEDPLWSAAGALPWVGSNFRAAAETARAADDVVQFGAVPILAIYQTLDWKSLAPKREGLDLAPLIAAKPVLAKAAQSVRESSDRLNDLDAESLLPQLSGPLVKARVELSTLSDDLDAAADFSSLAPGMLGAEGARNYLLMIQNNAEARATGGIPGALAKLTIEQGRLSLGSQTSAGALGEFSPPIDVDAEQQVIYAGQLGTSMQDVNLTPDFPTASKTAHQMWERKTGERLDGVISIDPVSLGYILKATGPVKLADPAFQKMATGSLPTVLNSQNVVKTLLSDVYSEIRSPNLQDAYFAEVTNQIFAALSSGTADPKVLMNGLTRGIEERRISAWSVAPSEQDIIGRHPLAAAALGASSAEFGAFFNDGTGAKMDYYVRRTVQLLQECPRDGYEQTTVRVTSTNTAPADAATSLPPYVTGGGVFGVPAGTVQTNIVTYGPSQAHVDTALVDGQSSSFSAYQHSDRPVGVVTLILAPGQSRTVDVTFGNIPGDAEPILAVTPTVQAVRDVIMAAKTADCDAAP